MKLRINSGSVKKEVDKEKMFDNLEEARMNEIEAKAETERQRMLLQQVIDNENNKMMGQIMCNMNKSNLYELDVKGQDPNVNNCNQQPNCQQNNQPVVHHNGGCQVNETYHEIKDNLHDSLDKTKRNAMFVILAVIVICLAVGVTPSGSWVDIIQENYVNVLVDIFKVGMLGIAAFLGYKLFKK